MRAPAAPLARRRFLGRVLGAWAGASWLAGVLRPRQAEAAAQLDDTPYVGEIKLFAGDFAPSGWAFCDGQLLQISDYEALFQLIGTTYGGDGQTTFALPDLRGRVPVHVGSGFVLGEMGGQEQIALSTSQTPAHTHAFAASSANGTSDDPAGRVPAKSAAGVPLYRSASGTDLSSGAVLPAGGASPHDNLQPYLGIHYILSLFGIFPSQT